MSQPILRAPLSAGAALLCAGILASCSGSTGSTSTTPAPSSSQPGSSSSATQSGEGPSAKEVWANVRKEALAATSATMVGTVTTDTQTMGVTITGETDGDPQRATLDLGGTQGEVTIVTVNKAYYMTGDQAFWTEQAGADAAKALKGKYVVIEEAAAKELGDFQVGAILKEMFSDPELSAFESLLTPVQQQRLGDADAWVLGAQGAGQLFVSADGKNQLLKIVGPKSSPGEFAFSGWNVAPKIAAPAKKDIVTP